jgi:hypothetical protein
MSPASKVAGERGADRVAGNHHGWGLRGHRGSRGRSDRGRRESWVPCHEPWLGHRQRLVPQSWSPTTNAPATKAIEGGRWAGPAGPWVPETLSRAFAAKLTRAASTAASGLWRGQPPALHTPSTRHPPGALFPSQLRHDGQLTARADAGPLRRRRAAPRPRRATGLKGRHSNQKAPILRSAQDRQRSRDQPDRRRGACGASLLGRGSCRVLGRAGWLVRHPAGGHDRPLENVTGLPDRAGDDALARVRRELPSRYRLISLGDNGSLRGSRL